MSSPLTTQIFIKRFVQEDVLAEDFDKIYEEHKRQSREATKKYREKLNQDPERLAKHKAYRKQYRLEHKDRINETKRESRERHRDHANQKCKEWYYKHHADSLVWKRKYSKKIRDLWGSTGLQYKWNDDIVAHSEEYVANEVIPKLGFHDVLFVRPLVRRFPFDILAKDKDGKVCGFDVKLGINVCINKSKKTLIDYLGVRHFIVHITRDMSFYVVKDMCGKRSSSAQGEFMDFVRTNKMVK